MLKKYLKYTLITLLLLSAAAIVVDKYAKHEYLNFLARYYFDEQYYIAEYPEVKNSGLSPFEHYAQIGWKEDKNPNAEFDNKLYRNLYFLPQNKYNLNPLADYISSKIKFKKHFINTKQLKKAVPLDNPKYYLSLVAIFRDESRFLKEWIEFYRMLGVEHFYLYNHLSKDNYMEVLQSYIDQGIVELYNVTEEATDLKHWNKIQTDTYTQATKLTANKTEWLLMIDTDEFLFPVQEKNLVNALRNYDEYAALSVNWKMFGSSDVQKIPDNKLLIETLLYNNGASGTDIIGSVEHVKTIVKPRYVKKVGNPHYPILKPGYYQITENFEYFYGHLIPIESRNIFRINHYWARDLDFFYSNKLSRIHLINKKLDEEQIKERKQNLSNTNSNISTTYDEAILKYVPELRRRVFGK